MEAIPPTAEFVLIETHAGRTIYEHEFKPGTWILFGRETSGMPGWLLNRYSGQTLRIPMFDARIRSLNLSNAVSIVAYEAIRQCQIQTRP
jgi:tRNA (cytidine/uridine-2'-O-)-methyltransferase